MKFKAIANALRAWKAQQPDDGLTEEQWLKFYDSLGKTFKMPQRKEIFTKEDQEAYNKVHRSLFPVWQTKEITEDEI